MEKLLKFFVYVSLFVLILTISKSEMSTSYTAVDVHETNYSQKNTPREKTIDFLLANHFFEVLQAVGSNTIIKACKSKSLFSNITSENFGNIHTDSRLLTAQIVSNLFLFKDSHYIFKLRKIII